MELKIAKNEDNELFNRKNVTFNVIGYDATPSKEVVKEELCKKINALPDMTVIVNLSQESGMRRLNGMAHVYSNKEDIDKYERDYILKRSEKKNGKKEGEK